MLSGALLSADARFRYHLWRDWSDDLFVPIRSAIFIMLNPSTADALDDDPTIRRCVGFARSWGCNRLDVVNLFALRATKPKDLIHSLKTTGLVGDPQNDLVIMRLLADRGDDIIVCAWGEYGRMMNRDAEMYAMLHMLDIPPMALRINEGGCPGHPLYVPADVKPVSL